MVLTLYGKSETNYETLGIGVLRDFKVDPTITEVLNGSYNLEFEYVRTGWLSEYLVEGNIIKANNQPFRIWNIKKNIDSSSITVLAKHLFFDLEKTNFVEDVAPTNKTADTALAWLLDHTKIPNDYVVTGDCTKVESSRYVRMNPIEAIYNADNAILKKYGGEIEIDNKNITVHNKRGKELGLEIRQSKNLNGADYSVDLSTVATRIMPIGRDGLLLPEKYIDSPLINNYFAPFFYKYEVDVGVDEENGVTLEECYSKMREEVNNLFETGVDLPQVSITVDFVELSKTKEYEIYSNLESAHLGDTVKVFIPGLNIKLTTRIVKTVYNCSKKRITKMELGSLKPNFVSSQVDTENDIKNALDKDNPTSILQEAKDSATSLITHPFSGHIYISEETGEMYLMDTTDVNTAQSIWKFGLGGIGYSSTGISGPYGIAMTQDGRIVADFITTGTLSASRVEGFNALEQKVSSLDKTMSDNFTAMNQTISDFMYKVQSGGGSNLLSNSVGYAGTESWQVNGEGTVSTLTSVELLENGVSGSAFVLNGAKIMQKVTLQANSDNRYTFSCKIKKNNTGSGYIKIYNDYDEWQLTISDQTLNYEEYSVVSMAPTQPFLYVEIYADAGTDTIVTDIMFSLGELVQTWTQANGEILNTDVIINNSGVIVKSSNYEIDGKYTVINPIEFSGYAKVNGVQIKVFTINGDTTVVERLRSKKSIAMTPIKIVPIINGENDGWAIVTDSGVSD